MTSKKRRKFSEQLNAFSRSLEKVVVLLVEILKDPRRSVESGHRSHEARLGSENE